MPGERERAIDRAVRALARRDHSAESLRATLTRARVSAKAREEAIDALIQAGYVDDARFALNRAERLAERGLGDDAIRHDLERQGVERVLAEQAVAALEPEAERAIRAVGKLGGGLRTARVLARKGFCAESIERALWGAVAE